MPLFEFRCESCQSEFELLVRASERSLCPNCHSEQLEKLVSAPAGHVAGRTTSLPLAGSCPPPSHGPCGTGCCRLP